MTWKLTLVDLIPIARFGYFNLAHFAVPASDDHLMSSYQFTVQHAGHSARHVLSEYNEPLFWQPLTHQDVVQPLHWLTKQILHQWLPMHTHCFSTRVPCNVADSMCINMCIRKLAYDFCYCILHAQAFLRPHGHGNIEKHGTFTVGIAHPIGHAPPKMLERTVRTHAAWSIVSVPAFEFRWRMSKWVRNTVSDSK